jgi:hypothetical protein
VVGATICADRQKDGHDKVIGVFHLYGIVLKIITGDKGTGWIKQLNCTECGVPYVDDVHKQLRVFHCMYSEM